MAAQCPTTQGTVDESSARVAAMDAACPMHVLNVEHGNAICEASGTRHLVSLFLLPHKQITPGNWLEVERGFALSVLSDLMARQYRDGRTQDQRFY